MSELKATVNGNRVVTGKVRLSYVNLLKPRAAEEGQAPKYSCALIIPKSDTSTINALKQAYKAAAENGAAKFGGKVPKNLKVTLKDGDVDADLDKNPEYEGSMYVNVSTGQDYPPKIVDAQLQPVLDGSEVYSGRYARVSVAAFAYNTSGNKGVSLALNNVQLLEHGEAFGGSSPRPDDEFGVVEVEDDEVDAEDLL